MVRLVSRRQVAVGDQPIPDDAADHFRAARAVTLGHPGYVKGIADLRREADRGNRVLPRRRAAPLFT